MYTLKISNHSTKLLFIFLSAFFIRLIFLDQSFWLDEATTAHVVKYNSLISIIKNFSPHDFHPPLYYVFLKIWSVFFGYSEIVLRLPSLLFSLATGFMIYHIGRLIRNKSFGLWSALFFLFNPLAVYYSQEARMYMMATFLVTCAFYFFIKNEKRKNKNDTSKSKIYFFGCHIVLTLAFFTFYGSIFFIITVLMYVFLQKKYSDFFVSCLWFLFSLSLVWPLMYQQLHHAREQLVFVHNWSDALGKVNIKNLFLIPLKFSFGRISFFPKFLYYISTGVWTLCVFYFVFIGGMRSKRIAFFFIMPLLVGIFFSFITPLLSYFRFLFLIPLMSVLLACGVTKKWQKIMFCSGFCILSFIYLFNQAFHREDWKSLARDVAKDKKVYIIYSSSDPIKYYNPDIIVKDLYELRMATDKKIIVIPYSADIWGVDYQSLLRNNHYFLKKRKSFRGLTTEEWEK